MLTPLTAYLERSMCPSLTNPVTEAFQVNQHQIQRAFLVLLF